MPALRREGPLTRIWERIDGAGKRRRTLTELPARSELVAADSRLALGRRWRHDQPGFWERLSPLARPLSDAMPHRELSVPDPDLRSPPINGSMDDREDDVEEEPWR